MQDLRKNPALKLIQGSSTDAVAVTEACQETEAVILGLHLCYKYLRHAIPYFDAFCLPLPFFLARIRSFVACCVRCVPVVFYESWVVPAGVPSALADIGGGVEANY